MWNRVHVLVALTAVGVSACAAPHDSNVTVPKDEAKIEDALVPYVRPFTAVSEVKFETILRGSSYSVCGDTIATALSRDSQRQGNNFIGFAVTSPADWQVCVEDDYPSDISEVDIDFDASAVIGVWHLSPNGCGSRNVNVKGIFADTSGAMHVEVSTYMGRDYFIGPSAQFQPSCIQVVIASEHLVKIDGHVSNELYFHDIEPKRVRQGP